MTVVNRRKGAPRRVTAQYLDRAALAYLQRFASSAESLRRVLLRRVERSARAHETDPVEGRRWVEELIERYSRAGLLDDAAYAEAKAQSLRRRGDSARLIVAKLAAKGIDSELAADAIEKADGGENADEGAELAAAFALAKRKRVGPFRPADRDRFRDRDLAALARAGFNYEVARTVVSSDIQDAI